MEKEEHNNNPHMYNTPNNLIKKEGDFFRNLTSQQQKPLWLRVCTILFAILIIMLPGIIFLILSIVNLKHYQTPFVNRIAGLATGIFFIILSISIISKNIK